MVLIENPVLQCLSIVNRVVQRFCCSAVEYSVTGLSKGTVTEHAMSVLVVFNVNGYCVAN